LPEAGTAILVGPGLAAADVPEQIKTLTTELWRKFPGPVIIDASALAWLPFETASSSGLRVITPHPGEAARLLKCSAKDVQANRLHAVRDLSRQLNNTWVVLKGHQTIIGRATGQVYINSCGNPHLAQGGSGDVLSGYLAGLLAQPPLQMDPLLTLRYGVWQHGATADALQKSKVTWVVEDLAAHLGEERPA
jgi:NAD(P)H-hydrate epimerase